MFYWRITKYNPHNRAAHGAYVLNTWTSYSDIGQIFDGDQFTYDKYLATEDAYVGAIMAFMDCLAIESFRVVSLEKKSTIMQDTFCSLVMIDVFNTVKEGQAIAKELVPALSRLILRELLWCKLEAPTMYVHFGYDFYMYIGSENACKQTILDIEKTGLFVEQYISPYGEQHDE